MIPAVLSLSLTGIYCFVDAFFVGNKVGDSGLAAINISFAFISVVFSLGTGIGAGGSVKYSVNKARGNDKEAGEYIGCAMLLCLISCVLVTVPMITVPKQILTTLGASEKVSEIGTPYLFINGVGSIFQIFCNGTLPVVRNCGGNIIAMVSVVSGCVLNILLDWLFVWVLDWGIEGAALATVIGQILACGINIVYLVRTGNFRFGCRNFGDKIKGITGIGITPFGLCLVPNISVVILNKASLHYGGDPAIAAYGCMAYLVYIVYTIMQGVGDGAQPLISTFHGRGDEKSITYIRRKAFTVTLFLAAVFFILEFLFSEELGLFMGCTGESLSIVRKGLPVLAAGFFFVGIRGTSASYLYAREQNVQSYIISYSEPLMILISLLLLPKSLYLDRVWWSNTAGQFLVTVISVVMMSFCKSADNREKLKSELK